MCENKRVTKKYKKGDRETKEKLGTSEGRSEREERPPLEVQETLLIYLF